MRATAERGVTLTEVLIALVILGVVVAPLTAAIVVYLRNTDATIDRMAESHDAQIASAYFMYDVQNTGLRDWSTPPYTNYVATGSIQIGAAVNASPYGCGSDSTASLVRFLWDDPADTIAGNQIRSAAYVVKPIDATVSELHRVTCAGGVLTDDQTIVDNIDPTNPPIVACPDTIAQCTASPTPPAEVRLTLQIRAPGSTTSYTIELRGQRRQT
jgi:prepilin-type N-terminal cleavage/methylation domain-containing protein